MNYGTKYKKGTPVVIRCFLPFCPEDLEVREHVANRLQKKHKSHPAAVLANIFRLQENLYPQTKEF